MTEENSINSQIDPIQATVVPVSDLSMTTSVTETEVITEEKVPLPVDFNWDHFDKRKFMVYTNDQKVEFEKAYNSTLKHIKEHQIVSAKIVNITDKYVVLNIGYKSDGLVPVTEFKDSLELLQIGNSLDVYLENLEDEFGQVILSRKKAKIVQIWDKITEALENETIIEGLVKRRTKGGLVVDLFGVEAFLPGSQIDVKPIRDYDLYVGKKMEFRVVKINNAHENVVVSHKILIEKDLEEQRVTILKNLEKGQVLEGIVKNITDFGVFIDLGGLDGLLHLTDLTWGRINHPSEILKLDQKINVVVLDFDDNKKRISLGLKQLESHPWDKMTEDIQIGTKIKGRVVTVADYGVFVELKPGVEGLIHVTELSWSQHLRNPQDYIKVGDMLDAVILTLDKEERKMSLSVKQLNDDPWKKVVEKYPIGSRHKSIVRNMTNFGLFVELEEGIDGLVHISDLSWTKKIDHPSEMVAKDHELEVVVLDVDAENRRLALGHKQLEEDPWETFASVFMVDSIHKCTITKIIDKGAILELPYGIQGFVPSKHYKKEDGKSAEIGETLNFKVIEFIKEARKITLSHSRIWQEKDNDSKNEKISHKKSEEKEVQEAVKKVKEKIEKTTFADIDATLVDLKEKMTNEVIVENEENAVKKKSTRLKKKETDKDDSKDKTDDSSNTPSATTDTPEKVE